MKQLGFTAAHFPSTILDIENYEFTNDMPVAFRFKTLDAIFPGSKFILTVRDEESWIDSCKRVNAAWVGPPPPTASVGLEAKFNIYGTIVFDPDVWLAGYRRWNDMVRAYFATRRADFLEMNICNGDGWEKLIPFVGGPFPRANTWKETKTIYTNHESTPIMNDNNLCQP